MTDSIHLDFYKNLLNSFLLYDATVLLSVLKIFVRKTDAKLKSSFESPTTIDIRVIRSVSRGNVTYDQTTLENTEEAAQRLKSQKLLNDKHAICKTLLRCSTEIRKTGTFEKLLAFIKIQKQSQTDENNFITLAVKNIVKEQRIVNNLEKILNERNFSTKQQSIEVSKIENVDHDYNLNLFREKRYLLKWEIARIALQKKTGLISINKCKDELKKYRLLENCEATVVPEMLVVTKYQIENLGNMCLEWMQRYDAENDSIDIDIQIQREQIEHLRASLNALIEEMKERKDCIENFNKYKENMKLRILREKMSIKIQAWWRGLMVRKKLGPFKPRKMSKRKKMEMEMKEKLAKGKQKKAQGKKTTSKKKK